MKLINEEVTEKIDKIRSIMADHRIAVIKRSGLNKTKLYREIWALLNDIDRDLQTIDPLEDSIIIQIHNARL